MAATKKAKPKKSSKKAAKPKAPKPKQLYIEGMEPPCIPAIDKLADELYETRAERMRLTQEEGDKADLLETKMKEHGLDSYEYDGKIVKLERLEKVKVRKKTPAEFVSDAASKRESNGEE